MWRYVLPGLAALALSGCSDCDEYTYYCAVRYAPYYGYYQDCYAVRNQCWDHHHCEGGYCDGNSSECKYKSDCKAGELCNSGHCVPPKSTGGAANGSGGAESDGSVAGSPGSGAASVDSGTSEPGDAMGVGAGGTAGSGHASSGGAANGGSTGSGGHDATNGGSAGSGGHDATNGGSAGSGGTLSGTGGAAQSGGTSGSTAAGGGAGTGASGNATGGGSSSTGRVHRFDFACTRDTQCGAGQCASGLCYLACESDADCGTSDRCSVESGRRLCMPDPNPVVRCDESAICRPDQTCINGTCHDPCNADADCPNLEDRCTVHLCFPDRRPIAECVLNLECAAGLVCLDARCIKLGE